MIIREGKAGDMPLLLGLIKELAAFEREPEAVVVTEADLMCTLRTIDNTAA